MKSHLSLVPCMLCIAMAVALAQAPARAADGGAPEASRGSLGFWKNVRTPDQFEGWRKQVISYYLKVMSIKPDYKALPLDTAYTDSVDVGGGVTRHRIEYDTTDGLRIPAFLFVPKTDKPVPVVIVYHGHGPGKICAAEREGTNENALARYIAQTLGYVVLAPDARTFGEFKIPHSGSHFDYFVSLMSKNKLYMGKLMEDGYQDLALLRTIPQADMSRLGVAGISMGSWRSLNFAVLHPEARATVVAGLYIPWEFLFSEKHCRCQHIPKLALKLSAEDFAATIFPRNLFIQWGQKDDYYKMDAEGLIERTRKITDFLGYSDHFTVDRHADMGHRFSDPEIADYFHELFGDGAWPPAKNN